MKSMTRRKKQSNRDSTLYSALESDDIDVPQSSKKKIVKRRKRKRRKDDDESFIVTNLKVGSIIAAIGACCYILYLVISLLSSRYQGGQIDNYAGDDAMEYGEGLTEKAEKSKIFPSFHIDNDKINAYNVPFIEPLMVKWQKDEFYLGAIEEEGDPKKKDIMRLLHALESLKQEFSSMYGGENAAREINEQELIC